MRQVFESVFPYMNKRSGFVFLPIQSRAGPTVSNNITRSANKLYELRVFKNIIIDIIDIRDLLIYNISYNKF